jgi:hypothetical protein
MKQDIVTLIISKKQNFPGKLGFLAPQMKLKLKTKTEISSHFQGKLPIFSSFRPRFNFFYET